MNRYFRSLLCLPFKLLPAKPCARVFAGMVKLKAYSLPPADGLRFIFEIDSDLYGAQGMLAKAYGNGCHTKHRHTGYHDYFVANINQGERVLDIGCGDGALDYDIAKLAGAQVTGIDILADNITTAIKRHSHPCIRYVVGDALTDIPAGEYDVIVLSNVLEHLEERPQFLRMLHDRYHPERFLIRVPMYERDWRVPLKKELGVEWRLDSTHEIEYTIELFHQEIGEAGLRVTHQEVRWGEIWAEVRGGRA